MSYLKTLAFAGLVIASSLSQAAIDLQLDRHKPGLHPIPCGLVGGPPCWKPRWPGTECLSIFEPCKPTPNPRPVPKPWPGLIN